MTEQQKRWLDHHRRMGSPYHLMMPLFLIECALKKKDAERIIKEYMNEVGPGVRRNFLISESIHIAVVWALVLFLLFSPIQIEVKAAIFGLALLMTMLKIKFELLK